MLHVKMVKSLMHWLRPYNRKTQLESSPSRCSSPNLKSSSQKSSSLGRITLHKITDIDDPIDNPFILTGKYNTTCPQKLSTNFYNCWKTVIRVIFYSINCPILFQVIAIDWTFLIACGAYFCYTMKLLTFGVTF